SPHAQAQIVTLHGPLVFSFASETSFTRAKEKNRNRKTVLTAAARVFLASSRPGGALPAAVGKKPGYQKERFRCGAEDTHGESRAHRHDRAGQKEGCRRYVKEPGKNSAFDQEHHAAENRQHR